MARAPTQRSPDGVPNVEFLVTTRSRRSTAGNRMKALLEQEIEKDEIFQEVENDVDFEAQDEVDIVDSDFDRDSSDGQGGASDDEDGLAGEREIEAQEKAQRKAQRQRARAVPGSGRVRVHQLGRAPPAPAARQAQAKRRRISFAPSSASASASASTDTHSASQVQDQDPDQVRVRVRTSSRRATVQNKLETEEKLREAEERRAALPSRPAPKKKPTLTQDALIAQALEVEEMNRESLRKFLQLEEERKANARVSKERITGPFIRWVSTTIHIQPRARVQSAKQDQLDQTEAVPSASLVTQDPVVATRQQAAKQQANTPIDENKVNAGHVHNHPVPAGRDPDADTDTAQVKEPERAKQQAEKPNNNNQDSVDADSASAQNNAAGRETDTAEAKEPEPGQEAGSQRGENSDAPCDRRPVSDVDSTKPSGSGTRHGRTFLSVERTPDDWEWVDDFTALLGAHCRWNAVSVVPARNRPLRPRQSICPITGLPALYKDPRTGIPYATAHAYRIISRLLDHEFLWTGGHPSAHGTGAAPIQMGAYLDTPSWLPQHVTHPQPQQDAQTQTQTQTQAQAQAQKGKPGYVFQPAPAIAPGDEQAIVAAAAQLPAGSTRSGRRVARR